MNVYVVALLCVAEVLTMTGVATYAALLPVLRSEWHATNTLAGVISGAFFGGYLMAVPLLVSLTDRIPARRVYVCACAALAAGALAFSRATGPGGAMAAQALLGAGLAGTYMPGLKELSDRTAGPGQSRSIAFYTSTFGIGNSLSLWLAGALQSHVGWRVAFAAAAAGPVAAALLIATALPARPFVASTKPRRGLFRAVLRDRRIAGYVIGYAAHCWELFAVRSWLVAFLAFAAEGAAVSAPTMAAIMSLLGPPASISGNEIAAGRRVRMVRITMATGAVLACVTGLTTGMGTGIVIAVTSLYVFVIMADSAAMTAGLIEVSPPEARGTAMAVYSFFGFSGALIGPITFGALLDAGGGAGTRRAWLLAFSGIALVSLAGVAALGSQGRATRVGSTSRATQP
ncbi:MAG: MFS transporter [Vicinamibacterales bacterium]